jgi:hypothetical protein
MLQGHHPFDFVTKTFIKNFHFIPNMDQAHEVMCWVYHSVVAAQMGPCEETIRKVYKWHSVLNENVLHTNILFFLYCLSLVILYDASMQVLSLSNDAMHHWFRLTRQLQGTILKRIPCSPNYDNHQHVHTTMHYSLKSGKPKYYDYCKRQNNQTLEEHILLGCYNM